MTERSYLVVDTETVPDPDLAWDAAREGFPPPTHHKVVALGVLWLDPDLRFRRLGVFSGHPAEPGVDAEAAVLEDFVRFVGRERCHLVTYNGRTFDLPVLVNRCLRHGISFRAYFTDRDYRYRYSDFGHVDLADVLSEHGATRSPRLESLASTIGLPGQRKVDGSMVASLFAKGQYDAIREGCLEDVVQTAFLFLRFELLRGRLDRDGYRERAKAIWDAVQADPRAKGALSGADVSKLLLGEAAAKEPKRKKTAKEEAK
ncbi:MAG: ribonuclease H-like domain-containing protein [Polyangiales bacterium]